MQTILLGAGVSRLFSAVPHFLNARENNFARWTASLDASLSLVRMRWRLEVEWTRRMIFLVVADQWEDEGFQRIRKVD